MRIKHLRQALADKKAEGRAILEAAGSRQLTSDERAKLDGIEAEVASIQTDIEREERWMDTQRADAAASAAPARIEVGVDRAGLQPFASMGEFLQAVHRAAGPNATVDPRLFAGQAAPSGASAGVPSDGGFLVRKDWSTALLDKAQEQSVLLPRCNRIPIGPDADGLEAPVIDETSRATGSRWGGVQVYRRSEAETVTASKPKLGKVDLSLEDMMGLFYATNRLLRDASALEAIASKAFASEFAFKIDDEIIRGTGSGQCLGVLNAGCLVSQAAEGGQTADTVTATNIQKMYSRMPSRMLGGSAWFINNEVWPQLFAMTQANNAIFLPGGNLAGAPFGTLLGRPIVPIEQCSAIGDVGDILFANFGEYAVIEKNGLQADSSMHVRFIYDEMCFRWIYRINGQPTWKSALTPYKGAATLSPFVALAAR